MKKLLSICFLSILLGLLSFSTQAQSSCRSGFWIENLQPETLSGVANVPGGDLVLDNVLNRSVVGATDLYEVHFCPCDGLDPKTKISIDWLLYRDGQLVNENLDQYAEISIYTLYPELTVGGGCQSIQWLGGQVPNNFGFCNHTASPNLIDSINGMTNCPQDWRTNYPGAMLAQYGIAPTSVVTNPITGTTTGAPGLATLYTEAFDYFYADFFSQTRTVVAIKWKQYCHNCSLVMRVRERTGGTDYNNAYWKKNADGTLSQVDYIGGHQSCCGQVLAMDSIHYLVTGDFSKEVCENDPYKFGVINDRCQNVIDSFLFTTAVEDTLVVFATLDSANCCHFKVDSVYNFHFFQRNTPEVVVLNADTTLCKCVPFTKDDLRAMVDFDTVDMSLSYEHKLLWWKPNDDSWWNPYQVGPATYDLITLPGTWSTTMPTVPVTNLVGTFIYYVRQENGYANFNKLGSDIKDTIHCTGGYVALTVTVEEIEKPILPEDAEFCMETIDSSAVHQVIAKHDPKCATTTRWYLKRNSQTGAFSQLVCESDTFNIQLITYAPTTNKDDSVKFYARSYDGSGCYSEEYATYTIKFHQTPELKKDAMSKTVFCPGATVDMTTRIKNSPDQTDRPYLFVWDGVTTIDYLNPAAAPAASVVEVSGANKQSSPSPILPINTYYKRNYSQQIFTSSEVPAGRITKLAFNYGYEYPLTTKSNNVTVYLTTTNKSKFAAKADFVTEDLQQVYAGSLSATQGWKTIDLTTPYVYDGNDNLVLVIRDNSGTAQGSSDYSFVCSRTSDDMSMIIYTDNNSICTPDKAPTTTSGTFKILNYRSDVRFTVEPVGNYTNNKFQKASRELTLNCDTAYTTSVYVIDGNGCKSEPVTFSYRAKDSIAPKVVPANVSYTINACNVTENNTPVYTKLNDLVAAFHLNVSDDCDRLDPNVTCTSVYDTFACEHRLTRIYTIKDACNNASTFTQVVTAHDSVKPQIVINNGGYPYVKLLPEEGGNCTFNSPDSMDFVNAVAPYVSDNCTDSAYLMSTIKFFWENTTESPINAKDIFKHKNHLTVTAAITDRCDNSDTVLVIYIDRPEHIAINAPSISGYRDICFNDTVTLTFDETTITDDTVMGPFVNYTYSWIETNNSTAVHFSAANATETEITFDLPGNYNFAMVVTDRNGCVDTSEVVPVYVRALPNVVIKHEVHNGQVEPYCPTYGDLKIYAELVNPVDNQYIPKHNYRWTGESVNTFPDTNATYLTIVPEWCDTLYYPTVTVTDEMGCVASVTDTVEAASDGPTVIRQIGDYTAVKTQDCAYLIPSFKDSIDATVIFDECYAFSEIKYSDAFGTVERPNWYKQVPAAGDTLKEATKVVKITVYTPCNDYVELTVNVNKPDEVLAVSIDPTTAAACQDEMAAHGVTFAATVVNAVGDVDYEWVLLDGENNLTNNADAQYLVKGQMDAGLYTYQVNVEDELGCTAAATATLTVYFQGADPILSIWPNTLCEGQNGGLNVQYAPIGYRYVLQHETFADFHFDKTSENPEYNPDMEYSTVAFGGLKAGKYTLTVYTTDGCVRIHKHINVPDSSHAPGAPTYTKKDVQLCTNNDGEITINALPNFTYELYYFNGDTIGALIGTGTTYNNLPVGKYYILATQNTTHCSNYATLALNDISTRPVVKFNVTNNNNCENEAGIYTGAITIISSDISSDSWQYTVYTVEGEDTTTHVNNGTRTAANQFLTGLKEDVVYHILAYDPSTGCTSRDTTAKVNRTPVSFTFAYNSTANHFCLNDTADGTIQIKSSTLSNLIDYNLCMGSDTVGQKADHSTNGWTSLYDGRYYIQYVDKYYCQQRYPTNKNNYITIAKDTVNPALNADAEMNMFCNLNKANGEVTLTKVLGNNAKIVKYNLSGVLYDSTINTNGNVNTVTYDHLISGTYDYYAVSNYNCKSEVGQITVDQFRFDHMTLTSTPNHMCAPTFEKPGDGTVTVHYPVVDSFPANTRFFHYYYLTTEQFANVDMVVPYELPLTKTKYWLAAGEYYVLAIDTISGCSVFNHIDVTDDLYTVNFDYATTPNYACNTVDGNGSITVVNATSTNPNAVFAYSIDGDNYQLTPVFNNLKDGNYDVYVKDTTMNCVEHKVVPVNPTDSCAPVITICDNLNACGNEFDYCYGAEGIQLCGTVNDTCNPTHAYTYAWSAPCADPNSSNTACIDVQTNHYVVNGCDYVFTATNTITGCSYSKVVNVAIHPNPQLYLTVNGDPISEEHTNYFCESELLHIAVHAANPTEVVLDTTSIQWTAPANLVGTGYADFYVKGDTILNNNITICVRANSKFGCPSRNYSLPITFKRIKRETRNILTCDGSEDCKIKNPNGTVDTIISKPATATYPYNTTVVRTYTSVLTGCDSVVTFNFTLNGDPEFTATPTVTPFCESEGKTLANFENGYAVNWNGDEGDVKWYAADGSGAYTKITAVNQITDGKYVITNQYGTKAMSSVAGNTTPNANTYLTDPAANVTNPSDEIIWTITKNSDNSYSIYSPSLNKYLAGPSWNTTNTIRLVDDNTENVAKWGISMDGSNFKFVNKHWTDRYLKYNTSNSPRFSTYRDNTPNTAWLSLYKAPALNYQEVPSDTLLTYDFVNANTIKRVATNDCGSDEEILDLKGKVYKQPTVVALPTENPYCDGVSYNFQATVTSYGTQGGAKLYANGVQIGDEKTFTGANQVVNFGSMVVDADMNGKNLTLKVYNKNNQCDTVTVDSIMHVFSTTFPTITNNATPYCVGDQITLNDFDNVPSGYSNKTVWVKSTPNDYQLLQALPYTLTNRDLNNAQLYVKADASPCFFGLVSNTVTIKVNDKPVVTAHNNINECASAFTSLPDMTITWNGSRDNEADSGWVLKGTSGAYAATDLNAIKAAAACPNTAYVGYFAKGSCGSDTTFFTVNLKNTPTLATSTLPAICPDSIVLKSASPFYTVSWNCETGTTSVYAGTENNHVNIIENQTTYSQIADYNTIHIIATNSCGSVNATLSYIVPTLTPGNFNVVDTCKGNQLKDFIVGGQAPSCTATQGYVESEGWLLREIGETTTTNAELTTTIDHDVEVAYQWTTRCGDSKLTAFKQIHVLVTPNVAISVENLSNHAVTVCEGMTINPSAAPVAQSNVRYATVTGYEWTFDGQAYVAANKHFTAADDGKKLFVKLSTACGETFDSIVINVIPTPNPTVTGDPRACEGAPITFTATAGYTNYVFHINGHDTNTYANNVLNTVATMDILGYGTDTTRVTVTVTDEHNCTGTSAVAAMTKVTNAPEFIFRTMQGTETHNYTVNQGQPLQYTWEISTECFIPDTLIYVEYDIYFNGQLISNEAIGEYLETSHYSPSVGVQTEYVTSNTFSWCASDASQHTNTSYYNYAIANPSEATSGNHFPNTNLGLGTGHRIFDDFWLSFMDGKRVTKSIVPFRRDGDYKIVYRLMATSHYEELRDYYSPTCTPITENIPMGGHSGLNSAATLTPLVTDSVLIHVNPVSNYVANPAVTPELAPAIVTDETVVAPEMEVWPNPAPAITTTFKARVHHMSGEATVTITSLAGKQIYNGDMNIDSDSYYFEASVNNLAVGTYVMTVRTADAIITKKVIVTR